MNPTPMHPDEVRRLLGVYHNDCRGWSLEDHQKLEEAYQALKKYVNEAATVADKQYAALQAKLDIAVEALSKIERHQAILAGDTGKNLSATWTIASNALAKLQ